MDLSGTLAERYHIVKKLGEGGMGAVYLARDTRLDLDVAVKIIHVDSLPPRLIEPTLKRFEREAKSLARLTHPNIVKVTDYGDHDGKPFLVLPYLSGGSLKDALEKRGMFPWREALPLLIAVSRAVEYAHSENLIHRDIKPANILIASDGRSMLADFGIAKIVQVESGATLTGTGIGIGTPEYMAPEQWTGQTVPQSDVYSLGVVLYEMVAGRKPFKANTPAALFLKQARESVPDPIEFAPDLPVDLRNLILQTMEKKVEDRLQSAGDFCEALETVLSDKPVSILKKAMPISTAAHVEDAENARVDDQSKIAVKTRAGFESDKAAKKKISTSRIWAGGAVAIVAALVLWMGGLNGFSPETEPIATNTPIPFTPTDNGAAQTATAAVTANAISTVSAVAVSTANSRATVAADSKIKTATAQSREALVADLENNAQIAYGPAVGSFLHFDDGLVKEYNSRVDVKNFILEVTFQNPYEGGSAGNWDYGVFFRDEDANHHFKLVFVSDGRFELYNKFGEEDPRLISELRMEQGFDLTAEGKNTIKLIANDNDGYLYVNGVYLTTLDLSARKNAGRVRLGSGFFAGNEVPGAITRFSDMIVWTLPE